MKPSKSLKLVFAIVYVQLAGFIGSLFTGPKIEGWYDSLIRPEIALPNWVFGPVWSLLFLLMAIAMYLVWLKRDFNKDSKTALILFNIQLVFNILWSYLFFGLQSPFLAFIEIIILWLLILLTIVSFVKISKTSAWLMLPYILWVSFAAILNYLFWQINL